MPPRDDVQTPPRYRVDEHGRVRPPEKLPRPERETAAAALHRRRLDRKAWADYHRVISEVCARCGLVMHNVNHEPDPATSIEGPDYYADFPDELHAFEPSGRWAR